MTGYQSQEKPYVDPGGHSIGQLWAIDDDDNTRPYSTIEVGWRMTRGAPAPQLFVFRFDDGAARCYVGLCASTATDCWQPASGAVEVPGNYLGYADVFHKYSINAGSNGSWWVWHDNAWLGYYIGTSEGGTNCWNRRPDHLNRIEYGGEVFSSSNSPTFNAPCTDMGNGQPGGWGTASMFHDTWRSQNNPYSSPYNNDADNFTVAPYTIGWWHINGTGDFRYGGDGNCGTFNRGPNPVLSVSPTLGYTNTSFSASLTSSSDPDGDALTYNIDWGDGTSTSASSGTHVYGRTGFFTVTGRVTDSFGAVQTATRTVEVRQNRPPVARLSVTPLQGSAATAGVAGTQFSADLYASSDPDGQSLTYYIDWGDGAWSTSPAASHVYGAPGTYTVTGRVRDSVGSYGYDYEYVTVCTVAAASVCV